MTSKKTDDSRRSRRREATYTPINDRQHESTHPAVLVIGSATPTEAMHIAKPINLVKVTASSGTIEKAARVPSAFAMARFWSDGVGEKGRRAWPPRRSSKERIAART